MTVEGASLYRMFDGDTLLYVGVTNNPRKRLRIHPWNFLTTSVSFTYYPLSSDAFAAEARVIVRECPIFNGRWKFRHDDVQKYIRSKLRKTKTVRPALQ